ncbi:bifunctional hydroxymethylpyrimidine kinase/phosphomethylpyrimidine kinase [Falsarthrobacter nasiphocae]|uniref:Hydroxymethylpyrimidine/phosphomethylpyrimidine kinase n=1 Tax=Falsarthrobacter nasiphocae TaxID=189863 RepID=A0AAE3YFW7_9MICC|nr:bifunctional hydroxymethylpyrimidine kinase/phosphomethylpyrimidine kinase [Falsarthrobacter nasiphocae]MDR6891440.1 hydroxymethylpyrimidine/phosphomethylpyrimidine kinase [Falsarthrobacter nasiphocae]
MSQTNETTPAAAPASADARPGDTPQALARETDLARALAAATDRVPRVLSIAGTDPTGGAGLQADLKSFAAMGAYGMGVVTALVAQNTQGVRGVHTPPQSFLEEQLCSVSDDVEIDAVKIGMLGSADTVETVRRWLSDVRPPLVVFDPVMVASSGDRLLDDDAEAAVRGLVPLADLVTPNIPELAVLTGGAPARTWAEARRQAEDLAASAGVVVLLKGGHLEGEDANDAVVRADAITEVPGERIDTKNTHGTGCSLSSAMAALGAWGLTWEDALPRAKGWLTDALRAADALNVGRGHGPVDHGVRTRHLARPSSWAREQWDACADVRAASSQGRFVTRLAAGTLERARFEWYLAQDLLYLDEYARALASLAAVAPTRRAQAFWARASQECLEVEAALHLSHAREGSPEAAPMTRAYTDHLLAVSARGSYAELAAAVLPCFWLYQAVGEELAEAARPEHPYVDWLATYGTDEFRESTRVAIELTDEAAGHAGPEERSRMAAAFRRSMELERDFFDAPCDALLEPQPLPQR